MTFNFYFNFLTFLTPTIIADKANNIANITIVSKLLLVPKEIVLLTPFTLNSLPFVSLYTISSIIIDKSFIFADLFLG